MTDNALRFGSLGPDSAHVCVDMQRIFAEPTEWMMPWSAKVLPRITALVEFQPEKTIFTRFIPARRPGQGQGMWKQYYERWASMTVEQIGADMLEFQP
jgi:nicotinamidase-related amidase